MAEATKKEVRKETSHDVPVKRYPLPSFDEFDNFLDNVFPRFWPNMWERRRPINHMRMPKIDVIDGKEEVRVYIEAPGVKKEDLDVSMTDHTVTIKGKTSRKEETKETDFYRCEIEQGEFSRTISLPAEVEGSKVKAKFENGLLELVIPKLEQSKRHSIKIE